MVQYLQILLTARLAKTEEERGATAVEYGLLVALIAAVIIAVVGFLGQDVLAAFGLVETGIDGTTNG